jgi:hypothetical protein
VSEVWKRRILDELKRCKVFVPLLSKAFKASQWCAQEIGLVVRRRVLIVPLSLDGTNPYGFISHIQGEKLRAMPLEKDLILHAIAEKWPELVIERLLDALTGAYNFRNAEKPMEPLVPYFKRFTMSQARRFAQVATTNHEIWNARECRESYIPSFLKNNKNHIEKTAYRALKSQIQHGTWYRP